MDYQQLTDLVAVPCCVISVEQREDGGYGAIRIACANDAYKAAMGEKYYDNMPYYELVPKDNKFEDFCFRAAVLGQKMHAYVETVGLSAWTDQTLIPLASATPGMGYCQFIFEFTQNAEADRMASLSADNSARFIKACIALMNTDNFQESVGRVLEDVMDAARARGCRIMFVDHEKQEANVFCDRREYREGRLDNGKEVVIGYDLVQSWEAMIGVSNAVIVKDEQDFAWLEKENPSWAESLRCHDVTSLILIPLHRGGLVVGYLYVIDFDVSRVVEVKELLELLSYVLGSEIFNYQLMQRLDEMSHTDALTKLHNRNAMIRRIHEILWNPVGQVGVLNLDVNGLKRVNDEQGHEAGDRLLVEASEMLRKFFYVEDIFRTGGDEFVVIIRDISFETFMRKVEHLRAAVEKNARVCFAIGDCWTDHCEQLQEVLRRADERMYADKAAFYQRNPTLRQH